MILLFALIAAFYFKGTFSFSQKNFIYLSSEKSQLAKSKYEVFSPDDLFSSKIFLYFFIYFFHIKPPPNGNI